MKPLNKIKHGFKLGEVVYIGAGVGTGRSMLREYMWSKQGMGEFRIISGKKIDKKKEI